MDTRVMVHKIDDSARRARPAGIAHGDQAGAQRGEPPDRAYGEPTTSRSAPALPETPRQAAQRHALAQLARDAAAGNRSAHDALGDHFYQHDAFAQAAEHYSAALLGELYRQHPDLAGPRSLLEMHDRQLIAPGSTAHAVAEHLVNGRHAARRRARLAALAAGASSWLAAAALLPLAGLPLPMAALGATLLAAACALAAHTLLARPGRR